jgi:Ca-activated chloride channel homolog
MKGRTCWTLVAFLLLLLPVSQAAETGRALIQQGNAHYAAGRYAEALKCYEAAAGQSVVAGSAELQHDRAAALFKLGQVDEARDLWVRLKDSPDARFEARTRYNLGNCDYADALTAAQQDGQKAVKLLGQAAEQYREALQLDPTLNDARANLELTQLLKRQIEEQQQNQQQNQQSKDQQKQDEQKQDQQQSSTQPSKSEKGDQEQKDKQDQQPQTQPSQSPESQQSSDEDEQKKEEESKDQSQQQQPQDQPQPESQPSTQPAAAESQPAERGDEKSPPVPIEMTREQAERLLQMIRDAEKARREKLAQERTSRQKPVERDW